MHFHTLPSYPFHMDTRLRTYESIRVVLHYLCHDNQGFRMNFSVARRCSRLELRRILEFIEEQSFPKNFRQFWNIQKIDGIFGIFKKWTEIVLKEILEFSEN